jgi:hypothetical protein
MTPAIAAPLDASKAKGWFTPTRWILTVCFACAGVVLASIAMSRSYIAHNSLRLNEPDRIAACRQQLLNRFPGNVDLKVVAGIHGLCYAEIDEEDTLEEFGIRKSALLNQQAETPVILWMVVGITLSGVLLAGVQLIAGYRLASAGKAAGFEPGGQISVESNKLSLRSSVTGVLILAISLLFFYVFVTQVYLIKEIVPSPKASVTGSPELTWGWQQQPIPVLQAPVVPPAGTVPPRDASLPRFIGGRLGHAPEKQGVQLLAGRSPESNKKQ